MKQQRQHKEYWQELGKSVLFWIGLVLALSYFFIDSFLIATIGLVLLFIAKYETLRKFKN